MIDKVDIDTNRYYDELEQNFNEVNPDDMRDYYDEYSNDIERPDEHIKERLELQMEQDAARLNAVNRELDKLAIIYGSGRV